MRSKRRLTFPSVLVVLGTMTTSVSFGNSVVVIEPPMVSIPAGEFLMGSDRGNSNEKPVRKVSVPAFQIGKYEVTLAEYRTFITATNYNSSGECLHRIGERWFGGQEKDGTWDNNIYTSSEFNPVVCVSREDAVNYAMWLSAQTGKHYRLPTEAEWEYAARGGTTTRFFFGDNLDSEQACRFGNFSDLHAKNTSKAMYNYTYGENYILQPCSDNETTISVVGIYESNPFGVYDLLGNVMERVADCYQDSYIGVPTDGREFKREDCSEYTVRGGHWHWEAQPASTRRGFPEGFVAALEGFRLVLDTNGKALPSQHGSKDFVDALSAEQAKVKALHDSMPQYPNRPIGLHVVRANENKVTIAWHESDESVATSYKIYRQNPLTNEKKLIGQVKTPSFTDLNPLTNNARYSVSAMHNELESPRSQSIDSGFLTPHLLPARIEGEAFSIADGAEVMTSSREPDNDRIINSLGNKSANYHIQVTKTGTFNISIRAFHSGVTQTIELWLGDKKLAHPIMEGERGWKTLTGVNVELLKGNHILTIKGEQPLLAINWLDVTQE